MTYANDPAFTHKITVDKYSLYIPVNVTDYHSSREQEATNQNIYSEAGATAKFLGSICEAGIKMIENDQKNDNLRTNMISILGEILYRTKYPVDSWCGVRMGAILSYIEYPGEDGTIISEPKDITYAWIEKKVQLAADYPELHTFFFSWGAINTPSWSNRLDSLNDQDYFNERQRRQEALNTLLRGSKTDTEIGPEAY